MKRVPFAVLLLALAATAARAQYVVDSLDVGGGWMGSMVYNGNPDWGVVYGTSEAGAFFMIDCEFGYAMPLAVRTPHDVAYDSIDDKCYVTYSGGGDESVRVCRSNGGRIRSIPLPWAYRCLWDAVANRLYVACGELNQVAVIDCSTDSVIAHIGVGVYPLHMVLNPIRRKLYVANDDDESVTVIDLVSLQVIKSIPMGRGQNAVAYSAVGDKCYFAGGPGLRIVACANDSVVADIALPAGAAIRAMTSVEARGTVIAACYFFGNDTAYTVDVTGDSLLTAVRVGAVPEGLAYSPLTDRVYCTGSGHNELTVLLGDGSRVVTTVPVSASPSVVLAVPDYRSVYVGHLNSRYVYVIRDTTDAVAEGAPTTPRRSRICKATPNPFRNCVAIECAAGAGGAVVCALDGRLVRRLLPVTTAGAVRFDWDGRDEFGLEAPPGVYTIVIDSDGRERIKVVKVP
jgi:YVTN family beta-propeller protein